MTYLELLRTLHDNGATTTASLLAALNDNALLAALGVADTALVDVLKHDINAERICLAILIGDGQNKTEYFATGTACRAYCEAENASIIERDHHGDKDKWLDAAYALEWVPVSVNEWLRYVPFDGHPLHGYICQQCGGFSPVGVGFVTGSAPAFRASHKLKERDCGHSARIEKTISIPVVPTPLDTEQLNNLLADTGTAIVNKMNLKALVANALVAYELLRTVYPTAKETNSALAAEVYSRAEELRLSAQAIKGGLDKEALQ